MIRVGMALYPEFQLINLAMATAFEYANQSFNKPHFHLTLMSANGGPVRTSAGVEVSTVPFDDTRFDTLLVVGDNDATVGPPALLDFLRFSAGRTRRIGGPCSGAFNLAGAGLLDGRRATTHWFHALKMKHEHPAVKLMDDKIFVHDNGLWTSAGATACIDLALAFIEDDVGPEIAKLTAKKLVVSHRRMGGQSQHSALLEMTPRTDRIHKALAYAKANLAKELSVEALSRIVHLSPRQFSRAFTDETGLTPAKAVERLRLEAARLMVESSSVPIDVIAKDTGFIDPDRMRRAFVRVYAQSPQALRRLSRQA
ncbi:GlxA family transcriptional regulator [Roseateles sp.]|uniref:GlxA family transcriptional regulator n=1 Tax=Roseateles sp. TaxID=1971397 RepID=UPI002F400593